MQVEQQRIFKSSNMQKPDSATDGSLLLAYYLSLSEAKKRLEFSTTAEAAKLVGLSQRTIQLWVQIGAVKAVAVGKKQFVRLESLADYLESRSEAANSE